MVTFVSLPPPPRGLAFSRRKMPRTTSMPPRLHRRRAPPPPDTRLYHRDYAPPAGSAAALVDHLTLESGDGIAFYVPAPLLSSSSFIADLCSLPGAKDVVPLQDVSAAALHFALQCIRSRRVRRHSGPPLKTIKRAGIPGILKRDGDAPPLLPSNAWSWGFLSQILTLAFAYDLTHALERVAALSGEFYDPVLGYTLCALVAAAKGDGHEASSKGKKAFPTATPAVSPIMSWAHALLRHDGSIPAWCAHALDTHLPAALVALQDLFARRAAVSAEMAAADGRITGAKDRRHSWDVFGRRASVATFLLRVDLVDAPATTSPTPSRRISLRSKKKEAQCTPACRSALKRTLTAATALATRQSSAEKFGTVEYFVQYTYEALTCAQCREKAREGLVWLWCMKVPWRGGVGL